MSETVTKKGRPLPAAVFALVAFLVGAAVTALAMAAAFRGGAAPPAADAARAVGSPPPDEHANEHASDHSGVEDDHDDEAGVVRLTPEGEAAAGVRAEPAALRALRESLTVPATVEVEADRVARITPPVAGKLVRLHVRLGDTVRAGQPLAVLDSYEVAQAHAAEHLARAGVKQAEAALQTQRAEVAQARTRLVSAREALQTQQELARAGVFSQAPLQAAQTDLAAAQSELLTTQSELQTHAAQLQRAEQLFAEGIVSRNELEQARLEKQQDEAEVAQARVRVEAAQRTLERERRVAQGGLLNRQAEQAAQAEVRAAEGALARSAREEQAARTALAGAREALAAARANLDALEGTGHIEGESSQITLYAPIAGVVSAQSATLGETVERGSPLLSLENLSAVIVRANVPEKDVARARAGLPVTVTVAAYPGVRFTGVVRSVAGRVDPKTRALPARCLVANPDRRLRPGMFASVSLPLGESRRVLAVPEGAVVTDRGGSGETPVVFVAGSAAGEYEKRRVTPGRPFGDGLVEIASGLEEGERVVVAGAFTLLSEANRAELSEGGHAH